MGRFTLAASVIVAFLGLVPAAEGHTFLLSEKKAHAAELASCAEQFTVKDYRHYARAVYQRERVSRKAHRRLRAMHVCQRSGFQGRKLVGGIHRRLYAARQARRRAARIAVGLPYAGPNGTRWAIPWAIVACESGGSWSAYNPSGARGPYQFLGWNVPWPVRTAADRAAHHRMAARLWAGGSGASNWQQCL